MGCANCSKNTANGKPRGCRGNGNCEMGCDTKLDVFDWLADVPSPDGRGEFPFVEVRFKNERKAFFRNDDHLQLHKGDVVVVEANPGHDVGVVSLTGELVRLQMQKKRKNPDSPDIPTLYRKAREKDIQTWQEAREKEEDAKRIARQKAKDLGLDMKISDVEYQGDGRKATFFYTAEHRVDFRQLIKALAEELKVRIQMHQIGMRQEAGKIGGIGSCGRPLCCSTWLTDFRTVSTSAARYQQLSLNPNKLAGQCGKLKCCLNFELDMYLEALEGFPDPGTKLFTAEGTAVHFKTDIFRKEIWYAYEEGSTTEPVPLSLHRVNRIIEMNRQGAYPDELQDPSTSREGKEEEPVIQELVGQDSLTRFDEPANKKKSGSQKKENGPKDHPSKSKK